MKKWWFFDDSLLLLVFLLVYNLVNKAKHILTNIQSMKQTKKSNYGGFSGGLVGLKVRYVEGLCLNPKPETRNPKP